MRQHLKKLGITSNAQVRPIEQAEISPTRLVLQSEAAAILRRSLAFVKRLRLQGKLGYYRGQPVTIRLDDLERYVASAKVRRVPRAAKLKAGLEKRTKGESESFEYASASASPKPFNLLTIAEAATKFERTARQIRYLCLRGRIPYILGRPPLIDEADLVEHFEAKRLAVLAKIPPMPGTPEFKAAEHRKIIERVSRKLRAKSIRREIARIFARRDAS